MLKRASIPSFTQRAQMHVQLEPGSLRIGVFVCAEWYVDPGLFQKVAVSAPATRPLANVRVVSVPRLVVARR